MINLFRKKRKTASPALPSISEEDIVRRLTSEELRMDEDGVHITHAVQLQSPFGWPDAPAPVSDATLDDPDAPRDLITENYARRDRDRLLRADLPIPITGTEAFVFIGIWAGVALGNHTRFRTAQARGDADAMGEFTGWLYSRLPPDTGPIMTKGLVVPQPEGLRPLYWITDTKHPLHGPQQGQGLSGTEIVALYRALGAEDAAALLSAQG